MGPSLPSLARQTLRVRRPTPPARQACTAQRRVRRGRVDLSGQRGQRARVRDEHGEGGGDLFGRRRTLLGGGGVQRSRMCPGGRPWWGRDEVQADRVGVARSREEGGQTGIGWFVGERPRWSLGRIPQSRQRRIPSCWRSTWRSSWTGGRKGDRVFDRVFDREGDRDRNRKGGTRIQVQTGEVDPRTRSPEEEGKEEVRRTVLQTRSQVDRARVRVLHVHLRIRTDEDD